MRLLPLFITFFSLLSANPVLEEVRAMVQQNEEIFALIDELEHTHHFTVSGNDKECAHLQAAIEHILAKKQAKGEVQSLMGVIHTDLAPAPLCTYPNDPSEPEKWETVLSRADILREYLRRGTILCVTYPHDGFEKRNYLEQSIFRNVLMEFSPNLIQWPLATPEIDPNMVGATYVFLTPSSEFYGFSIKTPLEGITSDTEWECWFGPISEPIVGQRVEAVFNYIGAAGMPNM